MAVAAVRAACPGSSSRPQPPRRRGACCRGWTSPAFVGFAAAGPLDVPVAGRGLDRFEAIFGADAPLAWDARAAASGVRAQLAPAVRAFFRNGGRRAWVVRVARTPPRERRPRSRADRAGPGRLDRLRRTSMPALAGELGRRAARRVGAVELPRPCCSMPTPAGLRFTLDAGRGHDRARRPAPHPRRARFTLLFVAQAVELRSARAIGR